MRMTKEERRARQAERDRERAAEWRAFIAKVKSANTTRDEQAERAARVRAADRAANLDLIQED